LQWRLLPSSKHYFSFKESPRRRIAPFRRRRGRHAGTKHDSNQELIGQGVANIFAPLSGGFAATGAIARTATNIRTGATSSLAGIAHAMFLILVVLFLVPLARRFPCAVCRQSCLWWRGI
jgi:hypothetical protein